ncbi:rhomboid-related protein 1-like [Diorhabda sublineata]|uniref:rhomboid-related protein 1-like n=1 Tax=Diorhabda sublineata TaxID=1163346 RepID=UPI0024E06792|nr:rhomboid-related protein 1-like [Diorhabda sublineata]
MSGHQEESIPMNDVEYRSNKHEALFNQCDTNRDGYITINELKNFVVCNETECYFIPKKALTKIMRMADQNGDEKLCYQEFVDLVQSKDFRYTLNKYAIAYVNNLIPRPKKARTTFRTRSLQIGDETGQQDICNEYSCFPPPVFMFLITVLEVVLFTIDELTQKGSSLTASGIIGKHLLFDPNKKSEVWRFVTYMFVHIGYTHLVTNLIVQLALGIPLEMVNKWWRVLTIYFLGGIAGSLAHCVIESNIRLGGASGGVYALLTAHLAQVIMNWSEMKFPWIQFLFFGILVAGDLGTAAYQRYFLHEINEIGVTCHVGGAVAGILVGIYILRNLQVTTTEKYIWWAALIVYIILTITTIVLAIML